MQKDKIKNTLTVTVSIPIEKKEIWQGLKRKSEIVQVVLDIASTYKNPDLMADDLRRLFYERRQAAEAAQ